MIVFKTFFKVIKACKIPVIIYTVMLIFFGIFNMQTSDNAISFKPDKPDILIINNDEYEGITKAFIDYIQENSNIVEIENSEEAINDALFYRDVNYIIYIQDGFREDFINNKKPKIEVKSTKDYMASLAEMMVERYINVANTYKGTSKLDENEIIEKTKETLLKTTEVEITSKLDTDSLTNAAFYYNFASYSLLAGCVYVICLVLSSFKEKNVAKRTAISSTNYRKFNTQLLLANGVFVILLWILYVIVSFILIGDIMFSLHGMVYIINSLIFILCALSIAFLIGNIIRNKEAINGIVNVVALGSSFLCGAFVPMEILPDFVLKIAHILPTYWYIKTNETIKTIETFDIETLKPILVNMAILLGFIIIFIIITNIIGKKRKNI